MTDHTPPSPADTPQVLLAELHALYRRWRHVQPGGRRADFVRLAERATKPQADQGALFPAPDCPPPTPIHAAYGTDTDVWFADFWAAWPRKVGKRAARDAWRRAVRRTGDPAVILVGARRYLADPNLPAGQFIPHPTTWLNQDRWEDGPLPAREAPRPAQRTRALVGLAQRGGALPALPGARR